MSALIPLALTPATFSSVAWQCSEEDIEAAYQLVSVLPGFDKTLVYDNERLAAICVPEVFDLKEEHYMDGKWYPVYRGCRESVLKIWIEAGVKILNMHLWFPKEAEYDGRHDDFPPFEYMGYRSSQWQLWPRWKHLVDLQYHDNMEMKYTEHLRLMEVAKKRSEAYERGELDDYGFKIDADNPGMRRP
jgi:hypothetical protein